MRLHGSTDCNETAALEIMGLIMGGLGDRQPRPQLQQLACARAALLKDELEQNPLLETLPRQSPLPRAKPARLPSQTGGAAHLAPASGPSGRALETSGPLRPAPCDPAETSVTTSPSPRHVRGAGRHCSRSRGQVRSVVLMTPTTCAAQPGMVCGTPLNAGDTRHAPPSKQQGAPPRRAGDHT